MADLYDACVYPYPALERLPHSGFFARGHRSYTSGSSVEFVQSALSHERRNGQPISVRGCASLSTFGLVPGRGVEPPRC
jgi:hypothetical protein